MGGKQQPQEHRFQMDSTPVMDLRHAPDAGLSLSSRQILEIEIEIKTVLVVHSSSNQ